MKSFRDFSPDAAFILPLLQVFAFQATAIKLMRYLARVVKLELHPFVQAIEDKRALLVRGKGS